MSNCPGCNRPARHVAATIPFDGAGRITVLHQCETVWCHITTFDEAAVDPAAVLDKVLRYRVEAIGLCFSADQSAHQDKRPADPNSPFRLEAEAKQ